MANKANAQELKGWDKVVAWYARNAYAVNMIYSLGASVVIIGALFKILHWPGASYVLMVGMFTESFLFMLGIFEKPHATYHWENVFPQLVGDETKELLGGNGVSGVAEKKDAPEVPVISEAELKALKEGIHKLGDTATQLASIGKVADATVQLTEKMANAGKAMETAGDEFKANLGKSGAAAQQFVESQQKLMAASEGLGAQYQALGQKYEAVSQQYQAVTADMNQVVAATKNFGKGVDQVNQQLSALNSVYELQIKDLYAQSAAFKAQTEKVAGVSKLVDNMAQNAQQMTIAATAAMKASQEYQAAQQKLAQQVADLNKVYGNMLNAVA